METITTTPPEMASTRVMSRRTASARPEANDHAGSRHRDHRDGKQCETGLRFAQQDSHDDRPDE